MISRQKLLKLIDADMEVCRSATPEPADSPGAMQRIAELVILTDHFDSLKKVGDDDQAELERILKSLEESDVKRYQHWREIVKT